MNESLQSHYPSLGRSYTGEEWNYNGTNNLNLCIQKLHASELTRLMTGDHWAGLLYFGI
jgi:hypothetical protein